MKRFIALAVLGTIFTSVNAYSSDDEDMKIRLAIALAKAKAEHAKKDHVKASIEVAAEKAKSKPKRIVKREECLENVSEAKAKAEKENRQLVLWVGMNCEDNPPLREALNECVNCHTSSYEGSNVARILIPKSDGTYVIPQGDLGTKFPPSLVKALAEKRVVKGEVCADGSCDVNCSNGQCSPATQWRTVPATRSNVIRFAPVQGNCPNGQCPR